MSTSERTRSSMADLWSVSQLSTAVSVPPDDVIMSSLQLFGRVGLPSRFQKKHAIYSTFSHIGESEKQEIGYGNSAQACDGADGRRARVNDCHRTGGGAIHAAR